MQSPAPKKRARQQKPQSRSSSISFIASSSDQLRYHASLSGLENPSILNRFVFIPGTANDVHRSALLLLRAGEGDVNGFLVIGRFVVPTQVPEMLVGAVDHFKSKVA